MLVPLREYSTRSISTELHYKNPVRTARGTSSAGKEPRGWEPFQPGQEPSQCGWEQYPARTKNKQTARVGSKASFREHMQAPHNEHYANLAPKWARPTMFGAKDQVYIIRKIDYVSRALCGSLKLALLPLSSPCSICGSR